MIWANSPAQVNLILLREIIQSYYLLNCIIDTVGKSHIFQTYNHFAAKAIITWMQSHSQTPSTNVQY